jgi:hypothetical protein
MNKFDAFEYFKFAWKEFCNDVLADTDKPGVYTGTAIVFLNLGDWLLEQIEETIDLHDDEDGE